MPEPNTVALFLSGFGMVVVLCTHGWRRGGRLEVNPSVRPMRRVSAKMASSSLVGREAGRRVFPDKPNAPLRTEERPIEDRVKSAQYVVTFRSGDGDGGRP